MRARLRAHRWIGTGWAAVALTVLATLGRASQIELPSVPIPLPVFVPVTVGTIVLITFPLVSAMPELEPTLSRERVLRVLRVGAVVAGAATVITLACLVSTADLAAHIRELVPLLVVLAALAILAVVTLGDLAWLVPTALGFLALMLVGKVDNPLSGLLSRLPLLGLGGLVILAAGLYVWRGPRLPS